MTLPSYTTAGAQTNFSAAASVAVAYPASVAKNAIAVIMLCQSTDSTGFTWPSGFTELVQIAPTSSFVAGAAWKLCDGTEGGGTATVNFTGGAPSIFGTSRMAIYGGVDFRKPFDVTYTNSSASSASVTGTGFTTLGADRLAVELHMYRRNAAGTADPSGWTSDFNVGANTARVVAYHKNEAAVATESAPVQTITAAPWVTATLVFRPRRVVVVS